MHLFAEHGAALPDRRSRRISGPLMDRNTTHWVSRNLHSPYALYPSGFADIGSVQYHCAMSTPILATKLHIPRPNPKVVPRPHLVERLNEGLHRKVTLISAAAGYGKTTLISEWIAGSEQPVAWLSLDEGDSDTTQFLTYFVAALQTLALSGADETQAKLGAGLMAQLQSAQPPSAQSILTPLINEIAALPDPFIFVLDDYHVIDAAPIDDFLAFLLERLPTQMHLVIASREDPQLPLARYRVRGQLTEVRANELQFSLGEAAEFLNQVMGLTLSAEDIASLETRTEGWIAGLQLAALSMQGQKDPSSVINSFSGRHHFVLDYLVEEVLQQQSAGVQAFLLRTSILDRLCGPLCDAVCSAATASSPNPPTVSRNATLSAQETLETLEQSNLFLVPLDNERRWYRYHHLFVDLLRQRLYQIGSTAMAQEEEPSVAELHIRASAWYADNGFEIEAFEHAVAAKDIERAERLIESAEAPLYFRGAGPYVLKWLATMSEDELNARPSLWVMYASTLLLVGQHTAVEQKLQAAEAALQETESDDGTADLIGRIASIRATLAVVQNDAETIIAQSLRAQKFLHPDNLMFRTIATWTSGNAYQLKGDRAAARQAYTETIAIGGESLYTTAATITLGQIQESENQLHLAKESYHRGLELAGDPPHMIACEAYLGLARICYEWNDFDAAHQHGQQCLQLTQQMENVDSVASHGVFLARLMLARGDVSGAATVLAEAEAFVQRYHFEFRMPQIAAAQVCTLLRQGEPAAAASLAQKHGLPLSQARVHLALGDPAAALAVLEPLERQMDAEDWGDEPLAIKILQALAHQSLGDMDKAVHHLADVLALTEPEGFIRSFVDEGLPMKQLLSAASARGMMPNYVSKLLAVIEAEIPQPVSPPVQALVDPLSQRELEILALIAAGLKNREIAEQLFLSLNIVLFHIKNIYSKLGVNKRTLAIIAARELDLLPDE